MPTYLVCARHAASEEWRVESVEVEIEPAVRDANTLAKSGAFCACVMEIGGRDGVPMFTFKHALKGSR